MDDEKDKPRWTHGKMTFHVLGYRCEIEENGDFVFYDPDGREFSRGGQGKPTVFSNRTLSPQRGAQTLH